MLDFLVAEPPIKALHLALGSLFFTLIGSVDCRHGRDDHMVVDNVVLGPVSWQSNTMFATKLQTFHHPEDLVHIATHLLRIVKNETDEALIIYDKDRTHGIASLARMHQTEPFGHRTSICNDGEFDFHVEVIFDPLFPFDVGEDLIDTQADKLGVQGSEFGIKLLKLYNSVVQTGVKSAGWLKSTNHLPDISSGRFIIPRVVTTCMLEFVAQEGH